MACKKSEIVSAINSFAAARLTGDANLLQYAGELVSHFLDTLEYAPEEETSSNDNQSEQSSEVV